MKKIVIAICVVLLLCIVAQLYAVLIWQVDLAGNLFTGLFGSDAREESSQAESTYFQVESEVSEEPSALEKEEDTTVLRNMPISSDYYRYLPQRKGYEQLPTESMKELYREIETNVYSIQSEQGNAGVYAIPPITIESEDLDSWSVQVVVTLFQNENPQVFWLSNTYQYSYVGNKTTIALFSNVSAPQCNRMIRKLNSEVSLIVAGLQPAASDLDREIYLFQKLAQRCSYDTVTAGTDGLKEWKSYTAYGALVEGKAVCEGYARAMQYLLSYAEINSILINGTGEGIRHMWNLVKIGNAWYHMDPTWNDNDTLIHYKWFNITDEMVADDHELFPSYFDDEKASAEKGNIYLPVCEEMKANYYVARAVKINTMSSEIDASIEDAIVEAVENGEESFSLYISEELDFEETIGQMFENYPYKLGTCLQQAAKRTTREFDYRQNVFVADAPTRSMTVVISYITE